MSGRKIILIIGMVICVFSPSETQLKQEGGANSGDSAPLKKLRYVNPLVIENAGRLADPTVIKYQESYYLYQTGGFSPGGPTGSAVWSSEDLVHWKFHKVSLDGEREITAPTAVVYKDYVYLTGNDMGLYRSPKPLGPFEYIGDFLDNKGQRLESDRDPGQGWDNGGVFDPAIFVDEDDRVYLYYAGGSTAGVYGVELDPTDLRKFLSLPKHFFRFETSHIWERYGNWNEYGGFSWIEGPWMTKRDGIYYLQYAAPGTDWKTYAVGVYTSKNPLGPFTYHEGSPILLQQGGLINGCAHHSVVEGPGGNLWAVYTLLFRNWNRMFERRIGMDPVGFDKQGNMFIRGPSEIPQWAPGIQAGPEQGNDSGSIPLSVDKNYTVSSEAPGRNAPYAVDDNTRTWWAPAEDDQEPWVIYDLGSASGQEYIVDSARIIFMLPEGDAEDSYSLNVDNTNSRIRHFKIEVSANGKTFKTVVDKTRNNADNVIEFIEIDPIKCRHVKLIITGWPKGFPCGIIEFTVFGKPWLN